MKIIRHVEFFKNTLIYLDNPYFDTVGYASPFDFTRYRNAVNSYIGKYIYSCRVSVNNSVSERDFSDYNKVDKMNKKIDDIKGSFKGIVDYYEGFTSAKYGFN